MIAFTLANPIFVQSKKGQTSSTSQEKRESQVILTLHYTSSIKGYSEKKMIGKS